jgi:3D (Asp-Asp-Asp) domain-containing protein
MLKEILTLMFALALIQSNIQGETIEEAKNTMPIENKVVQTVKVEKEREDAKVEPKVIVKTEEKWKIYSVSAYTNGYESTQKHKGEEGYGIQANGKRTVEGSSIACPKSMKFGTEVKIKELDNTYVCSDRGSAITEGKLDIFMEDLKRAEKFGRKNLHVQIIKKEVD